MFPLSDNSPTNNPRLSDLAFEKILEWLSNGKLRPGDWLRQESLANELDVSQVTIREALNKLILEGIAERVPRKGVRLPFINIDDLMDIYQVRLLTEEMAWKSATEKIVRDELCALRELLPDTGTNADPKSVEIARRKNQEFHMIVIRASGRKTLVHILTQLLNMDNLRFMLQSTPKDIRVKDGQVNIKEHEALIAALERRDSELVGRLIKEHISRSMVDRLEISNRVIQSR